MRKKTSPAETHRADRRTRGQYAAILCDRGTLDGLAYWPGTPAGFYKKFGIDREQEMNRYAAVIHLEFPTGAWGYEKSRIRSESVNQAHRIDALIQRAWNGHLRFLNVPAKAGFLDKLGAAIELLRGELPVCCCPDVPNTAS